MKISTFLVMITISLIANLFSLSSYASSYDETVLLSNQLRSMFKGSAENYSLGPIEPAADGLGINVEFIFKLKSINANTFNATDRSIGISFTKQIFSTIVCTDNQIIANMQSFVNNGHYLNIIFNDYLGQNVATIKIDNNFCQDNNNRSENSNSLQKQLAQNYYDENFLNQYFIPNLRKSLPKQIIDELSITDVSAGPGSVLTYTLEYTSDTMPTNIEEKANYLLNEIAKEACKNDAVVNLSKKLDRISYIFKFRGETLATQDIQKGCIIY